MLRAELLDFAEAAIFHIFREQLVVRSGDNYSRRALYLNIFPVGSRHLHKSVGGSKKIRRAEFCERYQTATEQKGEQQNRRKCGYHNMSFPVDLPCKNFEPLFVIIFRIRNGSLNNIGGFQLFELRAALGAPDKMLFNERFRVRAHHFISIQRQNIANDIALISHFRSPPILFLSCRAPDDK